MEKPLFFFKIYCKQYQNMLYYESKACAKDGIVWTLKRSCGWWKQERKNYSNHFQVAIYG